MASLAYLCFVPAKGLIRDLSANSSNITFEVPIASKLIATPIFLCGFQ